MGSADKMTGYDSNAISIIINNSNVKVQRLSRIAKFLLLEK